jgi:glycosyltransferase involved in cell wall biosynthesis
VARLEPENHVLEAVHGYLMSEETRPLLVVGSAPYSQWYIDRIKELASDNPQVRLLGGLYDQELLDQLYANARTYIHGHSVGGTNPSLLRAMGAGAPVLAFDCEFNREVTAEGAFYWDDADALAAILDEVADGDVDAELAEFSQRGRERIAEHYRWDAVTDQYEALLHRLADRRVTGARRRAANDPSGHVA